MTTPATATIAALDEWLSTQPPLGRAMAQPMVSLVTDVLTAQQAMLDASMEQNQSLTDQVASAWAANRTLEQKLHAVITRVDVLEKKPFTPTSERTRKSQRTPDARREARKRTRKEMSPEERAELRAAASRKRQAKLDALPTVTVTVDLPSTYTTLLTGAPRVDVVYEWRTGQLVRVEIHRQTGALADGVWVTAPRMDDVAEGGVYGPGLYAKVVTDKCLYAMPLRRQEREFRDLGAPIPVSSLCNMFHRAALLVSPLYTALLHHVRNAPHVFADETPLPILDEDMIRRGWMWVFATDDAVLFTHSPSRGKGTPERVLGQSMGTLLVDGYTAYNSVTGDLGRARGGCWSHARRGLYEARAQAPDTAQRWLDAIGELFYIERVAKDEGILASAAHRERRETLSAPIVASLFAELDAWSEAAVDHSNALYKAVQYVRNQRVPLQLFLTEPAIPIHNNLSERALRAVALLRKNSLFAGHDDAAQNYGMLLSLLTTCCMHDVDPKAWLADVLIAVQESRSGLTAEDLLPWNWKRDRGKTAKPLFDLAG